ncbi:MAG: tetratricopeptide repeat protein [Planctomycetota bacterium]|nr:tetratricopeptide repeat protein [Planctomycetota bacterium]
MSSQTQRSGAIRTGLLALLLIPLIVAIWTVLYLWVERSSRDLIYRKNASVQGIERLDAWAPLMLYPAKWSWLKAEAYRKLGDRPRVSRLVDEMAAKGPSDIKASSPLWLLESAAGRPGKVKDNLGPLLVVYKSDGGEVLASLVQGFLNQGDHPSASQALRLWNELYEQDPKAAFWQGVYSTVTYDLDSALQSFQKAIELDPQDPRARQELAEVYLEKANFEDARGQFEWLMKNQPTPEVITGYARALLNLGLTDEAALQLKKLDDVSKLPSPELALVCETNLEADQAQQASEQASILLKRWPNALPYLQLKARSLAKLGETSESEKFFAQAAESQNKRPQVDQMIERMATDSANQELRRDMGELMMSYLDPAGGVGYIQIASRTNPFDIKTQELLVSYYEKEGDLQVAQNHRRMIRQIEQAVLNSREMSDQAQTDSPQP